MSKLLLFLAATLSLNAFASSLGCVPLDRGEDWYAVKLDQLAPGAIGMSVMHFQGESINAQQTTAKYERRTGDYNGGWHLLSANNDGSYSLFLLKEYGQKKGEMELLSESMLCEDLEGIDANDWVAELTGF